MSESIGYLEALSRSVEPIPRICNSSIELLGSEPVLVDGVQLKQTKYVVDDSAHRFDGLSCADFALENLQASGVDLRQVFCRSSQFSAVDHLEVELAKMADFSSHMQKESSKN